MRISTLLLLPLMFGCVGKPSAGPIVLGVLAPLSGPQQRIGCSIEQGVQLAIEGAKEQPIDGRAIEALVVDTQGDAETTSYQAVRLITINRVAVLLGGHDVESADKLCRVGETYQASVVTLRWLPARQLGPYGVTVAPAPVDRGKALAQFALAAQQRVAVLTDSGSPSASVLTAAFLAQVKSECIAFQGLYQEKDLAMVARTAAASKPDVALLAGQAEHLPAVSQQLAVPILWGDGDDGAAADFWTSALAVSDPASLGFVEKFSKRFGQAPDVNAALAYDASRFWIESARKVAATAEGKIMDELTGWKDFPSVSGRLAIDKEHTAHRPLFVFRREQGAVKLVGTWQP